MGDKLKAIGQRALEYWNKWTTKQKTIIIGIIIGVLLAVGFIVFLIGRTRYTSLYKFESTEVASQAITSLKANNIATKLDKDNLTVLVDEDLYVEAVAAVYSADLGDKGFSISNLLDTSITTTNSERLTRNFLYSQSRMEDSIMNIEGITSVSINYMPKDISNSIIAANQTIPASVKISYNNHFNKKHVNGIAEIVASGLGNSSTEDITIVDQNGEVLFDGLNAGTDELDITDKLATEKYLMEQYVDIVTRAIMINNYQEVEVSPHLVLNWDKVTEMFEDYLPLEGEDKGVLYEEHTTSSENTAGAADVPGTDPNNETDYMLVSGSSGNSESSTMDRYYKPNVHVKNTVYDTGTVQDASISVTARRVIVRTKTDLELLGLLEDTTYEEYVLNNQDPVKTATPEELITVIALATGIDPDRVTLITYDIYQFINDQESQIDTTTVVQISLAVLLFGILLFVIIRSMKPVEITEVEPELSIEQLLATTKESQALEEVEFSEESETRRMIEKFFDENPEAVASLLRNWLNEDWM